MLTALEDAQLEGQLQTKDRQSFSSERTIPGREMADKDKWGRHGFASSGIKYLFSMK